MLTDNRIRGGRQFNYVIERNWEFIEGLKCSRFNYGMSQKTSEVAPSTAEAPDVSESVNDVKQPPKKRAKYSKNIKST